MNNVVVVPLSGVMEHEPFEGGRLMMKLIALELVCFMKMYVTSNRQRSTCGYAKKSSWVDVKLLVFDPMINPS